jgi:hypothetical protein
LARDLYVACSRFRVSREFSHDASGLGPVSASASCDFSIVFTVTISHIAIEKQSSLSLDIRKLAALLEGIERDG